MTDVVTGAAGRIGNVLIQALLKKGHKVRALVRKTSDTTSIDHLGVEKVVGDILDLDSLVKAFRGADIVYHLAALIWILPGNEKIVYKVNIEGTKNVIKACLKAGVGRLVYTSTIHSLKESPAPTVIDETRPFYPDNPRGVYDRSKARASLEVLRAVREKGLDAVIVMPTGVIGSCDYRISPMCKTFIDFAKGKQKLLLDGAYDYVDVHDVALGHLLAAEKGRKGESYILSGERVTMDAMMKMLEKATGVKEPHFKLPTFLAKIFAFFAEIYYKLTKTTPTFTRYSINTLLSNSYISHKKATQELGYSPRPVEESIRDTVKWLKKQGLI